MAEFLINIIQSTPDTSWVFTVLLILGCLLLALLVFKPVILIVVKLTPNTTDDAIVVRIYNFIDCLAPDVHNAFLALVAKKKPEIKEEIDKYKKPE